MSDVESILRKLKNKNKGTKKLINKNLSSDRVWRKKELKARLYKRNQIINAIEFGAGITDRFVDVY